MTKHTPGPWHVEIGPGLRAVRRVTGYDEARAPYVARAVCDLPRRHDKEEAAALLADASLIAAAPDMLEALQAAMAWVAEVPAPYREFPFIVKARAAIAKATGAEPGHTAGVRPAIDPA